MTDILLVSTALPPRANERANPRGTSRTRPPGEPLQKKKKKKVRDPAGLPYVCTLALHLHTYSCERRHSRRTLVESAWSGSTGRSRRTGRECMYVLARSVPGEACTNMCTTCDAGGGVCFASDTHSLRWVRRSTRTDPDRYVGMVLYVCTYIRLQRWLSDAKQL